MADAPFNTASINPVQLLGVDGAWPISTTNPLPISGAITASFGGSVSLAASTASIGSATIIGSLPAGTNPLGKINLNATAAQLTGALISFSAPGTTTVITGTGSTVISVYRIILNNSTATALTFANGTNALTGPMSFGANGGLILDFDGEPYFVAGSGANFNIQSSSTSQVSGRIYYLQA